MSSEVETNERSHLEQGGITTTAADISVPLVAAEYTHPTLPGRTITRLVPEPLLRAEDLSLGVTGLSPHGRTAVGHTRRRAIGFPAWPILTDPDNSQHALNLVVDLERAGRLARSSPKKAKDEIMALAAQLDNSAPHFLPTFLEEAGRMYIAVESPKYASQMYALARDAERRHSLPVDEERHFEAVMEFAYAGAISAKELSAEAKNLGARREPAEAYETFRTLCIERVRGGLLPYSGMKRDLAKLAKAAGLNVLDEETGVAAEMLRASSIEQVGHHFWKDYEKAIARAVADDDFLMERLLSLAPNFIETDPWLEVLRNTGALERVKTGAYPDFVPHIVQWASALNFRRREESADLPAVLSELLPHAGCTEVVLEPFRTRYLTPGVIVLLLSHGVPVTIAGGSQASLIDLKSWNNSEDRIPLSHLVAQEDFKQGIIDGLIACFDDPAVVETLAADPHLRPFIISAIAERVEKLESAPPPIARLLKNTEFVRGFEHVPDAEIQALLDRVRVFHADPAISLAETLKRGIPEELGWLEIDELPEDLQPVRGSFVYGSVDDCWPGIIVHRDKRAVHIEGRTVTDIPNGAGVSIDGAMAVDSEYALEFTKSNRPFVQWSNSSKAIPADLRHCWLGDLNATVPVPGGRLVRADTVMRPGQGIFASGAAHFFVDNEQVWIVHGDTALEIDPATGTTGRASLPDWLEAQRRRHPDLELNLLRSQHRPVTEATEQSPFSTANGYHRHAVFTRPDDYDDYCLIVDADGTEYTVTGEYAPRVCGVLRRPGGGTWILTKRYRENRILDPSDLEPTPRYDVELNTGMWWHHTRVRDAEASAWFRKITAEELRPLMERVANLQPEKARLEKARDELTVMVGKHLGLTDQNLSRAVACHIRDLQASWPQHGATALTELPPGIPTLKEHIDVLDSAAHSDLRRTGDWDVWKAAAELGLHERSLPEFDEDDFRYRHWTNWFELLGKSDALLALAAVPGRTEEEAQGLKEMWIQLREAGVLHSSDLSREDYDLPRNACVADVALPPRSLTYWAPGSGALSLVRAGGDTLPRVKGRNVPLLRSEAIPACRTDLEPVFDALIERIRNEGPLAWTSAAAEAFASATGAPLADAELIMTGFPNFNKREVNFLPTALRTALGLKVKEAQQARDRLASFSEHFIGLLAAGVPEDATRVVHNGLDAGAMAHYWSEHCSSASVHIPSEIRDRAPKSVTEAALQRVLSGELSSNEWAEDVATTLWLANELNLSDPARLEVAHSAEALEKSTQGVRELPLEANFPYESDNTIRRAFNLPNRDFDNPKYETLEIGCFTIKLGRWEDTVVADLSGITNADDPDMALARELAVTQDRNTQAVDAATLRASGAVTAYAEWLRQTGAGDPHDPLAVVPELVDDVAATLPVSQDAARYYLQLLALPGPTDANVRRWNSWRKADITAAGAELVQANVVVEGKRPRAGRSFFLPGGWIEAQSPHLPLELWKAEAFSMVAPGRRSKYEPMLGVAVPPLPPPRWFAACWERSRGDDAPRFDELETTRRTR